MTQYIILFIILFISIAYDHISHKKEVEINIKKSMLDSLFWILLSILFGIGIYFTM